jgi:hypothetical protein
MGVVARKPEGPFTPPSVAVKQRAKSAKKNQGTTEHTQATEEDL